MTKEHNQECLVCNRDEAEIPLLKINYRGGQLYICPQHLPLLIHDPAKLDGLLPGAGGFEPYKE